MIVGVGKSPIGNVLLIGLIESDIDEMRKGLTKTKEGSPEYGFSSLVVFMGTSHEDLLAKLTLAPDCKRRDDMHPNAGSG
jgi:hypothetical protein